jgi:hypothetical protein
MIYFRWPYPPVITRTSVRAYSLSSTPNITNDIYSYAGNPDDPVQGYPSEDPENWTYAGNVPDVAHDFKDYVEPLTREQMLELMKDYSKYEAAK